MADDEVATATALAGNNKVVIFECAGVSRLLNDYILRAPAKSEVAGHVEQPNPRIRFHMLLDHFNRSVGGGVVHKNNFVLELKRGDAGMKPADQFRDNFFFVKECGDDG